MLRDPTMIALADCGKAALKATNGHGRRWAVDRCVRTLVASGTQAGLAERSARAMVVVAQAVDRLAGQAPQQAGEGPIAGPRIVIRHSIHVALGVLRRDLSLTPAPAAGVCESPMPAGDTRPTAGSSGDLG